ncbi:hypothetical protein [Brevibacillus aydinogluensis]|uniref:Uncharacterized protein n=1 Tax=Brevibacillus aydinogluensis TaxID=927786 RepID=A0AA48MEH6_9BACL|nr:hypothetical protein [Brevibacillus aydinogluensis]CAJ1004051.1 hypothetical protein BSPP4475_17210 [Brevibacillus aydinogluensis]
MRKWMMAAAAAIALTAAGGCEANNAERQERPAVEPVVAAPRPTVLADEEVPYTPETLADNVNVPWALDVAPDGRIFLQNGQGACA